MYKSLSNLRFGLATGRLFCSFLVGRLDFLVSSFISSTFLQPHVLISHEHGVIIKAVDTKHTFNRAPNCKIKLLRNKSLINTKIYEWFLKKLFKEQIYPLFLLKSEAWISIFHQTFYKSHSFFDQIRFCQTYSILVLYACTWRIGKYSIGMKQ